jgi:1-acyl-sn-glycerol-3-phosphate acyltransferase
LVAPILVLSHVFGGRDFLIGVGKGAMRASRRLLGFRIETLGLETVESEGAFVFMANHLSFLDGPLLVMLIPRPVRVIIKKSVFLIPILGYGMKFVGFVPVDRKGTRTGRAAIDRAVQAIRGHGYSFLVFPEGTRSRDGILQPFRRGGFFLALESGVPIVPISIRGTFFLMPKGRIVPLRGSIRVTFHPPVKTENYTADTIGELSDRVRAAIVAGLE